MLIFRNGEVLTHAIDMSIALGTSYASICMRFTI